MPKLMSKKKPVRMALATLGFSVLLSMPTVAALVFDIGFSPELSESMKPTFHAGDLQITSPTKVDDVTLGDVILVRSEKNFATYSHRIVTKELQDGFYQISLKGDSNPTIDRQIITVPVGVQVPRVIWNIPEVGTYVNYLSGTTSKKLLIGFGILLFGLTAFRFALGERNLQKER